MPTKNHTVKITYPGGLVATIARPADQITYDSSHIVKALQAEKMKLAVAESLEKAQQDMNEFSRLVDIQEMFVQQAEAKAVQNPEDPEKSRKRKRMSSLAASLIAQQAGTTLASRTIFGQVAASEHVREHGRNQGMTQQFFCLGGLPQMMQITSPGPAPSAQTTGITPLLGNAQINSSGSGASSTVRRALAAPAPASRGSATLTLADGGGPG